MVKGREIAGFSVVPLTIEPSIVESFQQLITGKYGDNGAVVVNKDVGLALLKKHSIVGPRPAGEIKGITYGFGFSKKSPNAAEFQKMVDALRRLQDNKTIIETLRWHGLKASQYKR